MLNLLHETLKYIYIFYHLLLKNPSPWMAKAHLSHKVNTLVADGLRRSQRISSHSMGLTFPEYSNFKPEVPQTLYVIKRKLDN